MERREITIPAAGVTKNFNVSGLSVFFEVAGTYAGPDEVPLIGFNAQAPIFPIYEHGSIPYLGNNDNINRIRVTGTAESAGAKIWVLVLDECLPFDLRPKFEGNFKARYPVNQFSKSIAGAGVVTLTNAEISDNDGNLPTAIYISATDFDIRYAYGIDPSASIGFPLREDAQDPTKINSLELIQDTRFANKDTGGAADAELNILPEFKA